MSSCQFYLEKSVGRRKLCRRNCGKPTTKTNSLLLKEFKNMTNTCSASAKCDTHTVQCSIFNSTSSIWSSIMSGFCLHSFMYNFLYQICEAFCWFSFWLGASVDFKSHFQKDWETFLFYFCWVVKIYRKSFIFAIWAVVFDLWRHFG